MKVHNGTQHNKSQQPEQIRAESLDNSLDLAPVKEPREEDSYEKNSPVLGHHPDSPKQQNNSQIQKMNMKSILKSAVRG